jgi:hypothetical protein
MLHQAQRAVAQPRDVFSVVLSAKPSELDYEAPLPPPTTIHIQLTISTRSFLVEAISA